MDRIEYTAYSRINSKLEKDFVPGSQNSDIRYKRKPKSFYIHHRRVRMRSIQIKSAVTDIHKLTMLSYLLIPLLFFDNDLNSFRNLFATAFHPQSLPTRIESLSINNRLYQNLRENHFKTFTLLSSASDGYNSNDNKRKNSKKKFKRKKMIIDLDKEEDDLNDNFFFTENASENVKDVTSNLIAPLAIDEDILGDFCSTNNENEDCILLNYDSKGRGLNNEEIDLNGIEMTFVTEKDDDGVDDKYDVMKATMQYNDGVNTNNFQDMRKRKEMVIGYSTDKKNDQKSAIKQRKEVSKTIDNYIKFIPFIAPLLAFMTYDLVSDMFNFFIEFLSKNTWQSVDGRTFEIQTITPAINGIVVPSVSILFATLSGTTISTLRQRQLDIRTCLNMEGSEIRFLQSMVDSFPSQSTQSTKKASQLHQPIKWKNDSNLKTKSSYPNIEMNVANKSSSELRYTPSSLDFQDKCRDYLIKYTGRLIRESQPGVVISNLEFKGSLDSEMNGLLAQMNEMTVTSATSSTLSPHPTILAEAYGAISRLNSYRSTRISALQSTFPTLHFVIVATLGASICFTFLMETNQEILYFLNEIQLKMLWTILIGTNASLGVVCYDLLDPFRGSYQVCIK